MGCCAFLAGAAVNWFFAVSRVYWVASPLTIVFVVSSRAAGGYAGVGQIPRRGAPALVRDIQTDQ